MSALTSGAPQTGRRQIGIIVAVLVLVSFAVFSGALLELGRRWSTQDEYSHGFFIPFISLWLLWSRRDAIQNALGSPSWGGPVLIVLAAAMHLVGELSALYVLSQVGFVVVLLGIALAVGGLPLLKVTAVPIIFLLFAIPLPYFVDSVLSWRLQLISSELGVLVIRLFQIPVYLEGNVIDLGVYKLQVVEACSGLRYLYPFLSLGFLAAYMFHAPMWQRAIVFLSTVPITIVMNSFRIGMIGVMVDRWGPQSADGFLHFFEGWIIFLACAVLLAVEIALLARLTAGKKFFDVFFPPKVVAGPSQAMPGRTGVLRPLAASFVLLCFMGAGATATTGRQEIVPERKTFATFPDNLGNWRGRPSRLDPQVEHYLFLTDYILTDYDGGDGRVVNFYVAYYASQRKGVSPHSPSVCLPGNGWQMTQFERTSYRDEDLGITVPFNRVVIARESHKQLVYYWFVQRGRRIENEWLSKWYLLTDAIFMNRTDGALVRLTTLMYPGETERDADKRLQSLIRELEPRLVGYLPQGNTSAIRSSQSRMFGRQL
jgi:exosortase D (VPLPA-CTERM-specific)